MPPRDSVALAVSRTPTQPSLSSSCLRLTRCSPVSGRTEVLRVAVLALAIECVDRRRISRIARVSGEIGVALLAQARPRDLQQEVVDRAVRIVTVQAVL